MSSGKFSLRELREKYLEPDSTMWRLRLLVHSDREALATLLEYLQSDAEPVAAQMMAVFALAQPQSQEAIEVLAKTIANLKNITLANAACLTSDAFGGNGIGVAWNYLLGFMTYLGLPKEFEFEYKNELIFEPESSEALHLYTCDGKGMNYAAIITAMCTLLSSPSDEVMRGLVIPQVRKGMSRPEVTQYDRLRFREVLESSYLNANRGWEVALEALTDSRSHLDSRTLEVIGTGMSRLDVNRKLRVLDEVAFVAPSEVLAGKLACYLEECVLYLGGSPKEGEPSIRAYRNLLWCLITESSTESRWSPVHLAQAESPVIRERLALTMETEAGGELAEASARSVKVLSSLLISDKEPRVSLPAVRVLAGLIRNSSQVLSQRERSEILVQLSAWLESHQREQDRESVATRNAVLGVIK